MRFQWFCLFLIIQIRQMNLSYSGERWNMWRVSPTYRWHKICLILWIKWRKYCLRGIWWPLRCVSDLRNAQYCIRVSVFLVQMCLSVLCTLKALSVCEEIHSKMTIKRFTKFTSCQKLLPDEFTQKWRLSRDQHLLMLEESQVMFCRP